MPRPLQPPRLYLARATGRPPSWVIRDGHKFIRTGAAEGDRETAEKRFQEYLFADGVPPEWLPGSIAYRTKKPAMVYFATCEVQDFPIKIGMAVNVRRRMAALQVSLPYKIVVLGTMQGSQEVERRLHVGFYKDRLEGEWFRRTPELMEFIQGNCVAASGHDEWVKPH